MLWVFRTSRVAQEWSFCFETAGGQFCFFCTINVCVMPIKWASRLARRDGFYLQQNHGSYKMTYFYEFEKLRRPKRVQVHVNIHRNYLILMEGRGKKSCSYDWPLVGWRCFSLLFVLSPGRSVSFTCTERANADVTNVVKLAPGSLLSSVRESCGV